MSVQRICDPEYCPTECVEFSLKNEIIPGGRTKEGSNDACHLNVVTRSRCAAFTVVNEHAFCIDVDGICDRFGFSVIEVALEFDAEIGRIRRYDLHPVPFTKAGRDRAARTRTNRESDQRSPDGLGSRTTNSF